MWHASILNLSKKMYQKKPKKAKSPLAKAASKPKPSATPPSAVSTGSPSQGLDPYTKPFMGSFLNTIEQSAGKEAVAKAISHAKKGKLDSRIY